MHRGHSSSLGRDNSGVRYVYSVIILNFECKKRLPLWNLSLVTTLSHPPVGLVIQTTAGVFGWRGDKCWSPQEESVRMGPREVTDDRRSGGACDVSVPPGCPPTVRARRGLCRDESDLSPQHGPEGDEGGTLNVFSDSSNAAMMFFPYYLKKKKSAIHWFFFFLLFKN